MKKDLYMIYESAITPQINGVRKTEKGVEFVTVLQEADVKNRNGRIYPKSVIENALKSPLIQEKLNIKHDWFGEVGHPTVPDLGRQTNIDINNSAFRINEIWWEGNRLMGKCETLNNAKGRDMAALIEQGVLVSFSMRGQGNVARDNFRDALVVQEPLMLITFDWVSTPSHSCAYLQSICEETKNAMFNCMSYANEQVALNESLNLYENGAMIKMNNNEVKEKEIKDYYSTYYKSLKPINEVYYYDPADKVIEMNEKYVMLEAEDCLKKVAKNDYLLKSIRHSITEAASNEDCAGIAPLDCRYGAVTKPLMPGDEVKSPDLETKDVLDTVESSEDVKEYEDNAELKEAIDILFNDIDYLDEDTDVTARVGLASKERALATGDAIVARKKYDPDYVVGKEAGLKSAVIGPMLYSLIPFAGPVVGYLKQNINLANNQHLLRSDAFKELKEAVKKDSKCSSIVHKMNVELMNKNPNKKVLKQLKHELIAEISRLKSGMSKSVNEELDILIESEEDSKKKDDKYENPVEAEVKEKLGDDAENVSAELKDEESEDDDKECKGKECKEDKDEDDSEDEKDSDEKDEDDEEAEEESEDEDDDDEKEKKEALKEEFYKYFNIIAEETGLTEEADIIEAAVKYSDYMTEDCAYIFKQLNKKEGK